MLLRYLFRINSFEIFSTTVQIVGDLDTANKAGFSLSPRNQSCQLENELKQFFSKYNAGTQLWKEDKN